MPIFTVGDGQLGQLWKELPHMLCAHETTHGRWRSCLLPKPNRVAPSPPLLGNCSQLCNTWRPQRGTPRPGLLYVVCIVEVYRFVDYIRSLYDACVFCFKRLSLVKICPLSHTQIGGYLRERFALSVRLTWTFTSFSCLVASLGVISVAE